MLARAPRDPSTIRAPRGLRPIIAIAAFGLLALMRLPQSAAAQGIASGSVRGTVRSSEGVGLEGASVRVVNTSTGFAVRSQVFQDRFLVQGLELGGPYVVEVRHIGFRPQQSRPFQLTLGEPLDLAFVLAWAGDIAWNEVLDPGSLTWSPDGQGIAYSFVDGYVVRSVKYMSLDGSQEGTIVSNAHSPSWRR
jgi:Carboxypeptidase regulatory-like domain